jgi:uncharacterized membrane protein
MRESVPFVYWMTARAPLFRRAFVAATIGWAIALPLATAAAASPRPMSAIDLSALSVFVTGSVICHQIAERSFALWGRQMPVCARCTGIYAGAAIAAAAASLRANDGPRAGGRVLVIAAAPTVATLVFEWTTGITPSNTIRALAGLPIGAAVAWLIVRVLR